MYLIARAPNSVDIILHRSRRPSLVGVAVINQHLALSRVASWTRSWFLLGGVRSSCALQWELPGERAFQRRQKWC